MGIHKAWALTSSYVVDFVDWFQSLDKIQCEDRVWALSAALHWTNVLHCICVIQAATRNGKTFLRAVRSFNIVCAYLSAIEIPIIGPLSLDFLQSFWVAHAWEGWITPNSVYFALLALVGGVFPEVQTAFDSYKLHADNRRKSPLSVSTRGQYYAVKWTNESLGSFTFISVDCRVQSPDAIIV